MAVVAWVYGLLPPDDWDDDCEREAAGGQLALWNRLVAIEHDRLAGEDLLYRSKPELAAVTARLGAGSPRAGRRSRRAGR